jgi:predicted N-acetyltransferase YhbS
MSETAENSWTIRAAKPDELDALTAIERDAAISLIEAGVPLPDAGSATPLDVLAQARAEGLLFVAVDADDRPVGFLICGEQDGALYIGELDVVRTWQRRGIGRALVEKALEEVRSRRLWGAMLTTDRFAAFNAPFYASFGFSEPAPADMPVSLAATLAEEAAAGHDPARRTGMLLRFA